MIHVSASNHTSAPSDAAQDAASLLCPRCGYDLTPMRSVAGGADKGRCSECGLEFSWAALLDGVRSHVPGFFEHSRGIRSSVGAFWRTWLWVLLPHRFWQRVTIERRVRMSRACLWMVLLLVLARASEIVAIVTMTVIGRRQIGGPGPILTWDVIVDAATYRSDDWHRPLPIAVVLLSLSTLCAITLAVLPQTRRAAKVRLVLVARAWIYSQALLALYWCLYLAETAKGVASSLWVGGLSQWWKWFADAMYSAGWFVTRHADEALLLCLAWQLWYWHTATSKGLRIDRAWQITLAMAIISIIGTLALLGFLEAATLRNLLRIKG